MSEEWITQVEALEQWEAGTLGAEGLETLNRALNSEPARSRLVDQWLIARALPDALAKASIRGTQARDMLGPTQKTGRRASGKVVRLPLLRSSTWRTLGTAAAGVVLGAFGSLLLGSPLVFGKAGNGSKRVVQILEEGFESGENPQVTGVPRTPGVWSGDFGAVVTEQAGIKPRSGQRMFQFLRADYEGKPPQWSYTGDLYRLIDLHGRDLGTGDAETQVVVEGCVRSTPFQEKNRYRVTFWLYALEKIPTFEGGDSLWPSLDMRRSATRSGPGASAHRDLMLHNAGEDWEKLRVEMRVPPGTRYLMLSVHLTDVVTGHDSKREGVTEFPGQFLDDVRVSLVRDVPPK